MEVEVLVEWKLPSGNVFEEMQGLVLHLWHLSGEIGPFKKTLATPIKSEKCGSTDPGGNYNNKTMTLKYDQNHHNWNKKLQNITKYFQLKDA